MAKISIIVPVYNVEKYIKRCLDSIIAQTFEDIEIILVDDGSTDSSGIICDEYSKVDTRVRVIHKKNGGLSSARNAGIEAARGEFLGFIDSDDYISSDMFEVLYRNMVRERADLSICGIYQCYEGKKPRRNNPWYRVLTAEEAIVIAFRGKRFSVNAVNKLYRKALFNCIRYPEGKATEDAYVIVDVLSQCNRVVATSEQKYFYFHREGSITTIKSAANCFDCIEAYERNKRIIEIMFPAIKNVGMSRYCWAHFYALDRLLIAEDEKDYLEKEESIVGFLRSNVLFVVFKSSLSRSRKIAAIALFFSVKLYKALLKKNIMANARLNT